jgi:hypothetical protein
VWSKTFAARTSCNNLQDAGKTSATYDFDQNEVLEFSMFSGEKANFALHRPGAAGQLAARGPTAGGVRRVRHLQRRWIR